MKTRVGLIPNLDCERTKTRTKTQLKIAVEHIEGNVRLYFCLYPLGTYLNEAFQKELPTYMWSMFIHV
jgi:hypothetical protein